MENTLPACDPQELKSMRITVLQQTTKQNKQTQHTTNYMNWPNLQAPIDITKLFHQLRVQVSGDNPQLELTADPGKAYSAPWLILYHAEKHVRSEQESTQYFNESEWQRKRYGSAVQAVTKFAKKQPQLNRLPAKRNKQATKESK